MSEEQGPEMLARCEDNWVTAMGAWFPEGRVVLRGKDVLNDLGHRRWMEFFVYAITGRESPSLARLIEGRSVRAIRTRGSGTTGWLLWPGLCAPREHWRRRQPTRFRRPVFTDCVRQEVPWISCIALIKA